MLNKKQYTSFLKSFLGKTNADIIRNTNRLNTIGDNAVATNGIDLIWFSKHIAEDIESFNRYPPVREYIDKENNFHCEMDLRPIIDGLVLSKKVSKFIKIGNMDILLSSVLRWVNVSNKLKQPIILVGIYSKCIKVQIGNVNIIASKFSPFDGENCECVGILDIKNQ